MTESQQYSSRLFRASDGEGGSKKIAFLNTLWGRVAVVSLTLILLAAAMQLVSKKNGVRQKQTVSMTSSTVFQGTPRSEKGIKKAEEIPAQKPAAVLNSDTEFRLQQTEKALLALQQQTQWQQRHWEELQKNLENTQKLLIQQQERLTFLHEAEKKAKNRSKIEQSNGQSKVKKTIIEHVPTYTLQAVVPGRAWIVRDDGMLFTVAVGDNVRGFGVVARIAPEEGAVYARTGAVIRFEALYV